MGGGSVCECAICGINGCVMPAPGYDGVWMCATAPSPPCPAVANLGQPCDLAEGSVCNYGAMCSSTGINRVCQGGLWANQGIACPN
jgi:hypothetical protein